MKKLIEQHYLDNYKRMVKILTNRAGSVQNAEDVVQNAFELALRYSGSFSPSIQPLGAWFNSIMNNALRKFKAEERRLGMSVEYNEDLDEPCSMLEWEGDMAKAILKEIERKKLPLRQVLYLYFFKGYKPREIVCITDLNNNYVRMSVNEFKHLMRAKYGEVV